MKKSISERWNRMEELSTKGEWNADFHDILLEVFEQSIRNNEGRKTVNQLLSDIEKEFDKDLSK